MKPTSDDVAKAITAMGQVIPFFPTEDLAVEIIQRSIEAMVSTREQLEWLTKVACNTMKRFSLAELRGIFCSRYAPADGLYAAAETPGFTPEEALSDAERAYHEREALEYERKRIEWEQEAKLLGQSPEPFLLPPGICEMPKPKPEVGIRKRPRRELGPAPKDIAVGERRSPQESERLIAELQKQLSQKTSEE